MGTDTGMGAETGPQMGAEMATGAPPEGSTGAQAGTETQTGLQTGGAKITGGVMTGGAETGSRQQKRRYAPSLMWLQRSSSCAGGRQHCSRVRAERVANLKWTLAAYASSCTHA